MMVRFFKLIEMEKTLDLPAFQKNGRNSLKPSAVFCRRVMKK